MKSGYPDKISVIRGKGLILAIGFTPLLNLDEVCDNLFVNGYVVSYKNNSISLLLPLTIGNSDIDELIENLFLLLKSLD